MKYHTSFQRVEVGRVGRKDEKAERQRERVSKRKKAALKKKKRVRIPHRRL